MALLGQAMNDNFHLLQNDKIKQMIWFEYLFICSQTCSLTLKLTLTVLLFWLLLILITLLANLFVVNLNFKFSSLEFLGISFIFIIAMVFKDYHQWITKNLIYNRLTIQKYNYSKQHYKPVQTLTKQYHLISVATAMHI